MMNKLASAALLTGLLVTAASAATTSVTLHVAGMTCAICPITVRKALSRLSGVTQVTVHYAQKDVVVTYDDAKTSPRALAKATADAGYPATIAARSDKGGSK
mgnify:CR=1 FL=1